MENPKNILVNICINKRFIPPRYQTKQLNNLDTFNYICKSLFLGEIFTGYGRSEYHAEHEVARKMINHILINNI